MLTKPVETAILDDKTGFMRRHVVQMKGIEVNIRNRCRDRGGRAFTDMLLDQPVRFKPGEVKTLVISEVEANKLREQKRQEDEAKRKSRKRWVEPETWELTSDLPTSLSEEDAPEPTSSEASEMAASAEEQEAENESEAAEGEVEGEAEAEAGVLTDVAVADDDGTPARREPRVQRVQRVERVQRHKRKS